jgi:hypothetical protein
MNSIVHISLGLVFFGSTLAAQAPAPAQKPASRTTAVRPAAQPPGAQAGDPQLPYTPSLDLTAMDRTADPCVLVTVVGWFAVTAMLSSLRGALGGVRES